jgi:hypothetical protein
MRLAMQIPIVNCPRKRVMPTVCRHCLETSWVGTSEFGHGPTFAALLIKVSEHLNLL